jgi:exo-1,4-beta-D-glucosaminidase
VKVTAHSHPGRGLDGSDTVADVTIKNTSTKKAVAFFLRADLRRGSDAGVSDHGDNEVLPVFWSDDDVTLWPGESQTLHASYRKADLRGSAPVVTVHGWNVATVHVSAK